MRQRDVERANEEIVDRVFPTPGDKAFRAVHRPVLVPLPDREDGGWLLLLAERDPHPGGNDNGWSGPLLVPANIRDPAGAARASEPESPVPPDGTGTARDRR